MKDKIGLKEVYKNPLSGIIKLFEQLEILY